MPALAEHKLSKEEFHARYDGEKPYYEYWDGEAVQKAMPKWLHGLIQKLLTRMLDDIGFESASEVELHLDPNYEPVPDIIAVVAAQREPYPTKPFEVVIEILSHNDQFSRVLRKCRLYEKWGIRQIVIVDPQDRVVWGLKTARRLRPTLSPHAAKRRSLLRTLWGTKWTAVSA